MDLTFGLGNALGIGKGTLDKAVGLGAAGYLAYANTGDKTGSFGDFRDYGKVTGSTAGPNGLAVNSNHKWYDNGMNWQTNSGTSVGDSLINGSSVKDMTMGSSDWLKSASANDISKYTELQKANNMANPWLQTGVQVGGGLLNTSIQTSANEKIAADQIAAQQKLADQASADSWGLWNIEEDKRKSAEDRWASSMNTSGLTMVG